MLWCNRRSSREAGTRIAITIAESKQTKEVKFKRRITMRIRELVKGLLLVNVSIVWAYSVLEHITTVVS